MKRIAVFCGSRPGSDPAYVQAADALGQLLVSRNIGLVYGGGGVGLMGRVASSVMSAGGHVIGVMPRFLMEKERTDNLDITDLRIVSSMHERKAMMAELSDGFIALPGGFGTFEELFEILAWSTLGLHVKPFGLLNVAGFYDHLLTFLDQATHHEFIKPAYRQIVLTAPEPADLLALFEEWHKPPIGTKWLTPERT